MEREIVRNVLKVKRLLLNKEKTSFLNEKIAEAEGKKSLFSIVDSFLLKNLASSSLNMTPSLNWWSASAITF